MARARAILHFFPILNRTCGGKRNYRMCNVMQRMMKMAATALIMVLARTQSAQAADPPAAATPGNPAELDPASIALAERLADLARYTVSGRSLTAQNFRMAGTLLEAANKLNPTEPRFPRLWNDAM